MIAITGLGLSAPVAAQARPKLVGSPLAAIARYPDSGQPFYTTYARLTEPVPRQPWGTLLGAMRINGLGIDEPPTEAAPDSFGFGSLVSRGRRFCYQQGFSVFGYNQYPPSLKRAKIGDRVRVEVLIAGTSKPLVGYTRLRSSRKLTERVAARRLGCLGPRRK